MSNYIGDCVTPPGDCPACPGAGEAGVTINTPQFGLSTPNGNSQRTAYNGLMNSKKFKTYASSFTILKKSLTTVQPRSNNLPENTTITDATLSGDTGDKKGGPTNTGGPGDAVRSVPIITAAKSGWRARLITMPHQTGVDVKHNSYERYMARKRGWAMRCQNC